MPVTDLNGRSRGPHAVAPGSRGERHVHRQARLCAGDGARADAQLSPVCAALPRQSQEQILHLPRPIPVHGLRPAHLSRESARHRSLPTRRAQQALPHGHSRGHLPKHAGQREQGPRLAHLRRVCPNPDRNRPAPLCGRRLRGRTVQYRLRAGRHHHRPVPVGVPWANFRQSKGGSETAHPARFARQHPHLHPHLRRQAPRRPMCSMRWCPSPALSTSWTAVTSTTSGSTV
jgi:hypothetical protein